MRTKKGKSIFANFGGSNTTYTKELIVLLLMVLLLLPADGFCAYPFPDTGQTKCYNNDLEIACPSPGAAFYGQDAQYNLHPRSYTKLDASGNALPDDASSWTMVRDNVTGLIWEMKTTDGTIHDKDKKFTWCDTNPATNGGYEGGCGTGTGNSATDTEAFINALNSANYGGYSDWRMPTIKELTTLVNSNISYPGPMIDAAWFPNTVSALYWSSTADARMTGVAWSVYFNIGIIGQGSKWGDFNVRAVRGGYTSSNLVDNGNGTVTDTATGLMWQKATASGTYTWEQALAYCENLNLAGNSDWRLPDINELQSLVDYSRYNPAINPLLAADTVSSYYWSSTTNAYYNDDAWYVDFNYGVSNVYIGYNNDLNCKSSSYYVRAVRAGQSGSSGLVAYYPFNGNANDESGNGNNGTIYNASFGEGKYGNGLVFSGSMDSFVEIPHNDSLTPSQAITISLWAKVYSYPSLYSCLIYKAGEEPTSSGFKDRCYTFWATSGQGVHFTSTPENADSQVAITTSSNLYALNDFVHFVGIIDTFAHTMNIYINGDLVQSSIYDGDAIRGGNYPLRIGAPFLTLNDQSAFNGVIDEVRIYNRALSEAEIQALYNNTPHFQITGTDGNPITNQTPGTSFDIKLTARNADGSVKTDCTGNVYLSSSNGSSLTPSPYQLTAGGITTIPVTIGAPGGQNIQIRATGCGLTGASNFFNAGSGCTTGYIGGTVTQYKTKPSGATVNLVGNGGSYSATSDSDGKYNFSDVPSGSYTLWGFYNGGESDRITVYVGGCTEQVVPLNIFTACNPDGRAPILLVPGIMGSTLKDNPLKIIPTLHNKGWVQPSEMELYDGKATDNGWKNLRDALKSQGYVEGCTLFDVPYDWRMRNEDAANSYLRPAIIRAKQKSGSTKVNIIAHSMGGLVTRAYIQGSSYQNDIDRFAMIGTPNHGSALAYPMWDGPEPFTADLMGKNVVYTPVTVYLVKGSSEAKELRDYMEDIIEAGICEMAGSYGWLCTVKDAMFLYKDIAAYILEEVPSLWQLLPTEDFLNPYGKPSCVQNTWLANLNSSSTLSRLTTENDATPDKVRTKIFMGDNQETVQNVKVALKWCSNPIYPDGLPKGFERTSSGDGTVLTSSARLDEANVSDGGTANEKHAKLVAAFANDSKLLSFITGGTSAMFVATPRMKASYVGTPSLSVSTLGRVRPLVTSPTGFKSGIESDLSVNSIPDTTVSIGVDAGGITIDNAADGTYTVTLTNNYAEDYEVAITYVDAAGEDSVFAARGFNNAGTVSFTFTVNSGATDKLVINHAPLAPTNLVADAVDAEGLKTRLTWTASTTPDITGYNIYSKFIDEPYFALLGTTTTASFDTGHAWAENASVKARVYAVAAIGSGGTESFFSNTVRNNDRDHDGLTDEEETALGTNLMLPDTDSDGLKDGEENLLGTNPLLPDTDGDGYNDYAEVTAGSDPLDKDSVSVQSVLYGAFTGSGIWQWNGSGWAQLTPDNPEAMVASDSNLYGDFGGSGLWQWSGSGWTLLTPDNPATMIAAGTNLYASFSGTGIWQWNGSGWSLLTPDNPATMVAAGTNLYASFSGSGIWQWSGSGWSLLTPDSPEAMVASGTDLYGDFGGSGLWKWNGSGWTLLTPDNPEAMVASGSDLYGDFGGSGLWKWNGSGWSLLTPDNPEDMVASEVNLYGDFGGNGLWQWNGSGWTLLTPDNPSIMVTGN